MKKGEKSAMMSSVGDGKAAVEEEKGKRASHHTRIGMDFDPKTSKLCDQETVDKYLASYGFCLNPGIKIMFYPLNVNISQPRLKGRVYIYIPRFWHWG